MPPARRPLTPNPVLAKTTPAPDIGGARLVDSGPTPLVVDLDGTLQKSDLMAEGLAWLLRTRPLRVFGWALTLLKHGRAAAKLQLQDWVILANWMPTLPLDSRVVALLRAAHEAGRPVILATGSPRHWVVQLPQIQAFMHDMALDVMGTEDPATNLTGPRKAEALVARFGVQGFDYAGNSDDDVAVWAVARRAYVANATPTVTAKAHAFGRVEAVYPSEEPMAKAFWRLLRPHQWLKNTLVFAPMLAGHVWLDLSAWASAMLAFAAFSAVASGAYVVNDALDVVTDRAHPRKCKRPLASAAFPLPAALMLAPVLMVVGLMLALWHSAALLAILLAYMVLTFAYSFRLKHIPVADVTALAALWGLRLWGGAVAAHIELSYWLALFGFLMFYGLALLKRYVELRDLPARGETRARGYELGDAPLVATQGVAAGMLAVLVVALYLNSADVRALYDSPVWLWPLCPLLVWWLGRIWLLAHRGEVHDDPLVFAARDPLTIAMAAGVALLVMMGAA